MHMQVNPMPTPTHTHVIAGLVLLCGGTTLLNLILMKGKAECVYYRCIYIIYIHADSVPWMIVASQHMCTLHMSDLPSTSWLHCTATAPPSHHGSHPVHPVWSGFFYGRDRARSSAVGDKPDNMKDVCIKKW